MEKGKALESKIRNWAKALDFYIERFFDARSVGDITTSRPADYLIYIHPQLFFIECKDNQGKSMSIDRFTQIPKMLIAEKHKIKCLFVIRFLKKRMFIVDVHYLLNYINSNTKKSININIISKIGHEITNSVEFGSELKNKMNI